MLLFGLLATTTTVNAIDFQSIVNRISTDKTSTWKATLPSDRDIHRATDLIGGYIKQVGTVLTSSTIVIGNLLLET